MTLFFLGGTLMGFFATFSAWLNTQLAGYVGDNTARLARLLEPAIVSLATVYCMGWGYLQLTGRINEPFVEGLRRIIVLAVVLGMSLDLWLYNSVIVDTFYNAPAQLAAAVVGATDPVTTIDAIWNSGGAVADSLYRAISRVDVLGYLAIALIWVLLGVLCIYTMFLIALSKIALAVLLALGPLFIALVFFESTKRYFTAWLAQLSNYALITVLTVMLGALLLGIVNSFVSQTAALGTGVHFVDTLNMLLISMIVFLVLRQVMPIAASLGGGASLNTLGIISRFGGASVAGGRREAWAAGRKYLAAKSERKLANSSAEPQAAPPQPARLLTR
jgi:type IV secretion system protein VirB6